MQTNTENKQQFPTEEVTLPSKGLLYPKDSLLRSGKIEMKYMTAKEEDILTNQNYINNGTVIDKLIKSLIVTPINYNELLIGDKNAILVAARILGYGSDYEFSYSGEDYTIDLTKIEDKELSKNVTNVGKNEFDFTLPASKIKITFKLLTHGDEKSIAAELKGLKKINKNASHELTTRLKHIILSFNGEYDKSKIREFVDNQLLARDARSLRKKIAEIQPDVDLKHTVEDNNGDLVEVPIPIGINFFWPDVEV
jgi:hypothetical protein|tara:strand:- start:4003 stop:4761 length:759 start_codon:yes stop_codon:yes gene_type:complete